MISFHQVSKTYITGSGKNRLQKNVLSNLSFTAKSGEITAILGPNGAGKTTALRILSGLETADSGYALVNEKKIDHQNKRLFGIFSESISLYHRLSGFENIRIFSDLYGVENVKFKQIFEKLNNFLAIESFMHKHVFKLSQGEKMRINLIRSLIHDPDIIVLDEPTNGLDLASVRRLRELLINLKSSDSNKSILITTHVMSEVTKVVDKVVVLSRGRAIAQGNLDFIRKLGNSNDFEEAFTNLVINDEIDNI